jgi:hypothetical protein
MVTSWSDATGRSFAGVTVRGMVAVEESPLVSAAVTSTESLPFQSASGV